VIIAFICGLAAKTLEWALIWMTGIFTVSLVIQVAMLTSGPQHVDTSGMPTAFVASYLLDLAFVAAGRGVRRLWAAHTATAPRE
jgi:hypothetical protein